MIKNLLLSAAMLMPTTAFAAHSGVTLSHNNMITSFHGTPGKHTLPNWHRPKGKTAIIDTLGDGNAYNCCNGWTVSNPGSGAGLQWFAYAITPAKDATVTEIVEAVGNVTGTNSVTVALLADNGGVPGTVLEKKTVKNLETFGDCCGVAVDKLKKSVKVSAGTTYWVAAILPKAAQSNTWDAWNFSSANTNSDTAAFYNGTWNPTSGQYTAFAVYGK